jgi:hypothetical protein
MMKPDDFEDHDIQEKLDLLRKHEQRQTTPVDKDLFFNSLMLNLTPLTPAHPTPHFWSMPRSLMAASLILFVVLAINFIPRSDFKSPSTESTTEILQLLDILDPLSEMDPAQISQLNHLDLAAAILTFEDLSEVPFAFLIATTEEQR